MAIKLKWNSKETMTEKGQKRPIMFLYIYNEYILTGQAPAFPQDRHQKVG